jgi:hypothetical protein
MKVNTSLCMGITNQREYDDMVIFLSRGSLATKLVPVVSTAHLVVRELIGTMPSPYVGRHKNLPEVRVAQWNAQLELLFTAPTG